MKTKNTNSRTKILIAIIVIIIAAVLIFMYFNKQRVLFSPSDYCQGADITKDGKVDINDQSLVAANWQKTDCTTANNYCDGSDITKDGKVNIDDQSILAANWQRTDCASVSVTPAFVEVKRKIISSGVQKQIKLSISSNQKVLAIKEGDIKNSKIFSYSLSEPLEVLEFKESENTWLLADSANTINVILYYNLSTSSTSLSGKYYYVDSGSMVEKDITGDSAFGGASIGRNKL